jgi:hypothetical protein
VDNKELIEVNGLIRNHPVEEVGAWLRESMTAMKKNSLNRIFFRNYRTEVCWDVYHIISFLLFWIS